VNSKGIMKLSGRARALAVVAAGASLFAIPLAAPASAAVPPPGKCTTLATKTVATKINATLSKCTPLAATGGTGSGTFTSTGAPSGTLNITLKWASSKGTTKTNIKFATQTSKGKCPAGTTARYKITGKVTGGTGVAFKTFKIGQPVTGSVCSRPSGFTLEPGTALTF
jgi:hypothetical protein